jgi:RNA polymerase sigma-70 factor, Bacteroides expansion family 1
LILLEKKPFLIAQWICEIAVSDSQKAFESLYLSFFDRLLRFASLHVVSNHEAEEIVSDTFLAIWKGRKTLPEVANFEAYIYSIMRYKIIDHLRTNVQKNIRLDDLQIDLFAAVETTPEDDLITQEQVELLNDAINSLPNKCKIAFKMVREDKMRYKDVAEALEISVKTLETHLATATRKLRELLSGKI